MIKLRTCTYNYSFVLVHKEKGTVIVPSIVVYSYKKIGTYEYGGNDDL
jgi:hypothetical protein